MFFGLLGRSLDYLSHWYEPDQVRMRAVVKTKVWSIDAEGEAKVGRKKAETTPIPLHFIFLFALGICALYQLRRRQ